MSVTNIPITNISAIKKFFEADGGRKVEMSEFKALTSADKTELGAMCAAQLGLTIG